ncbi:MAG: hypothetical protein GX838_05425 [Clostridiaceae bacterium]|nr:hypothetical protein [Clostridiaceae bacterium]
MDGEEKSRNSKQNNDPQLRFILNIPNALTLIRLMAVAPLAVLIHRWPAQRLETFLLFIAIWSTDFFDGWIARRFDMITEFGKLFDPFVDKVFQVVTAFMMFSIDRVPIWVPLYYFVRESFMLFGSTLLLTKRRVVVFSDILGKIATFLFVVAVVTMFWISNGPPWLRHVVFIPPVLCSFLATIHYIRQQAGNGKKKDDSREDAQNT